MVYFDDRDDPIIAIDSAMSNMVAQEWVKQEHKPLVILEHMNGRPVQSILVHEDAKGFVLLDNFWGTTDLSRAVDAARKRLNDQNKRESADSPLAPPSS